MSQSVDQFRILIYVITCYDFSHCCSCSGQRMHSKKCFHFIDISYGDICLRSSSLKTYEFQTRFFFGFHYNYNSDYRYAMIITFNWKSNRILSELVCSRLRKILPFIYFRKNTLISNGYPTKRFIRILKKRSIFIKQLLYDNSFFNNKK